MEMLLLLNDAPSADLVHEGTLSYAVEGKNVSYWECTLDEPFDAPVVQKCLKNRILFDPRSGTNRLSLGAKRLLGGNRSLAIPQIQIVRNPT